MSLTEVAEGTHGYSSAELGAVLLAAANVCADHEREELSLEDLRTAVDDVIPSRDSRMLEFMEMLAVFESSSKKMLPERFKDMDTETVHSRLDQLRTQLGRRVQ